MLIPTDLDQAKMHTARILNVIHQEQQEAHRRSRMGAALSFSTITNLVSRQLSR